MPQELNNLQKQDIYKALLEAGINPSDTKFSHIEQRGDKIATRLQVCGGKCDILYASNEWHCSFQPGIGKPDHIGTRSSVWNDKFVSQIKDWLHYIVKLSNTPDPWETAASMPLPTIGESTSKDNTILSVTEYERVKRGLLEIKELFLEAKKENKEHQKEISERLDRIIEDGKKMGRKDWFNQIIAAVIAFTISYALPPDVVKNGFQILKTSMIGIIEVASYEAPKQLTQ